MSRTESHTFELGRRLNSLVRPSELSTWDPEVQRLIICLIFQLTVITTLESLSTVEGAILACHWQQLCCLTLGLQRAIRSQGRRLRRLLAHERGLHRPGFFDQNMFGSFIREFKCRMRIDVGTFEYLCTTLALMLRTKDTNMRAVIPVQVKVVVSISRLATSNSMRTIADLYRIGCHRIKWL